jgi:hypothetical protein
MPKLSFSVPHKFLNLSIISDKVYNKTGNCSIADFFICTNTDFWGTAV